MAPFVGNWQTKNMFLLPSLFFSSTLDFSAWRSLLERNQSTVRSDIVLMQFLEGHGWGQATFVEAVVR